MAVFKGNMYTVSGYIIEECLWYLNRMKCSEFFYTEGAESISFVYATHRLQSFGGISCGVAQAPAFVYKAEHRVTLEVHVADGILVDASGGPVDTTRADVGYSGRAAIFAMSPDGQILLSSAHRSGLINTGSFLAGAPVAAAGEIVVEQGVVKKIVACSLQYRPTIKLNWQVGDELYARGYKGGDEIVYEECQYTCEGHST